MKPLTRVTRAALVAVVLLAGVGAGCSDDEPAAGEGRLVVDGVAIVRSGDAEERVTGSRDLRSGDEVEMVQGGASVELADDVVLELREGRGDTRPSVIRMAEVPVLLRGELLVVAGAAEPAVVDAAGTTFAVTAGAARVSRLLNVQAGVYAGSLSVTSAAREAEVSALFQVAVPARGLVGRAGPLQLDAADGWDRRLLGDVIQLSDELDRRAQGFTSQAGAAASQPTFYLTRFETLGEGADGVRAAFRPGRPPGDHLIGAAITSLGRKGSVAERYERVFDFRAQGASWGLVAKREGVERAPLLERIDGVIADPGAELALAVAAPPGSPGGAAPPTTTAPTGPTGPGPGGPAPTQPPPTQPPPTQPPPTQPPPTQPPPTQPPPELPLPLPTLPPPEPSPDDGPLPTTGTPLDPVVEPVDELLGQLLP